MTADAAFLLAWPGLALAAWLVHLAQRGGGGAATGFEVPVLTLLVLAAGAGWTLATGDGREVALISALLVASMALIGLLFNAAVARDQATRLREERRSDVRRALRAEILDHVQQFEGTDWAKVLAKVDRDFAGDPAFVPFVPLRRRDLFLSRVLDRVEVLDEGQVESVVRFYTLAENISLMAADLRSATYRRLPVDRRRAMLLTYLELEDRLTMQGVLALAELGDMDAAGRAADVQAAHVARQPAFRPGGSTDQAPSAPEPGA